MAAPLAIRSAAWHLPAGSVRVGELPELAELPEIEREVCLNLGIDAVRVDDELDPVDLAVRAAGRALADAGLSGADVGALIVVESRAPQRLMSSEATRLQALLGAERAITFSVGGLGCASIAPALLAARGMLAADPDLDNVLVVHGSKPATPRRYRHPVTVSGDGGQALVLTRHASVRVLDMLQATNGEYWDLFGVDYRDEPYSQWREECANAPKYSFQLAMETRNRLRELHQELLDRNGLSVSDVDCHLSQNLSMGAFGFTGEALGVEIGKACAENLTRYGHLGPNDILLNLYSAIERGEAPDGGRVVLFNVSPVAAWSALLVEVGDSDSAHYL